MINDMIKSAEAQHFTVLYMLDNQYLM